MSSLQYFKGCEVSIAALNAVWKMTAGTSTEKFILLALADYADANGECFPSVRTLMKKTLFKEATVRASIKGLLQRKVLMVRERSAANGRKTTNLYVVLPGREEVDGVGLAGGGTPGGVGLADRGVGLAGRGTLGLAGRGSLNEPSKNEPPQEPGGVGDKSPDLTKRYEGKLPAAIQKEFEVFYDAYPFKKNRKDAERQFYFARRTTSVETIMEGLTRAKESEEWARVDRDGGSFIPHPDQFLKKERWRDEYKKKMTGEVFGAGIRKFLENQGRD